MDAAAASGAVAAYARSTRRLFGVCAAAAYDVHFHPAEPRELRQGLSWGM